MFQHTAARRRLALETKVYSGLVAVSTHSRPKAAGTRSVRWMGTRQCFNTQPPEGGWHSRRMRLLLLKRFNTQPPEGGWGLSLQSSNPPCSFNTQPPEGGWD